MATENQLAALRERLIADRARQEDTIRGFLSQGAGQVPAVTPPSAAAVPAAAQVTPVVVAPRTSAPPPPSGLGAIYGAQQQRVADVEAAAFAPRPVTSAPNPMYDPTRRYIQEATGAGELADVAAREQAVAVQAQARQLADLREEQMREVGTDLSVQRATQRYMTEERQRAIDAARVATQKITEAADKLSSAPDVDPNRFWADKGAGHRFRLAVLGALMGGKNMSAHLSAAIDRDIDAQKANIAKGQGDVSSRVQAASATSLYASLLADFQGDEMAADLAYRTARIEQAQRELEAAAARTGVPVLGAEQRGMLAQLAQQSAAGRLELSKLAASTPDRFISVSRMTPLQEKMLMERYKHDLGGMAETEKSLRDEMKAAASGQGAGLVGELHREYGAGQEMQQYLSGERGLYGRVQKYADKAEPVVAFKAALQQLNDHLESGGGTVMDFETNRLREVLVDSLSRMQSGAALTEDEKKGFREMTASWLKDFQVAKLRAVQVLADAKIENARRGAGDDAAAFYHRVAPSQLPALDTSRLEGGVAGAGAYSVTED